MTFGENVKAMLRKKKITQNELAKMIGMSSSGISTALSDDRNPRIDTAQRIASALGCNVSDLMGESPAGVPAAMELSMIEQQLIRDYRALDQADREHVLRWIGVMLTEKTGKDEAADGVGYAAG